MMYRAALVGAFLLEAAGYIVLLFSVFVLMTYIMSHFVCILSTPEPGFEWECARISAQETLMSYFE